MSIYHSQNQYHYTYKIYVEHNVPDEPRHMYLGVRSCNVLPEEDPYFGSSKSLNLFLKDHPEAKVTKTVLAYFLTRKDAGDHEIQLHEEFDVARTPVFFNLAKHTSTGFCTSGKPSPKKGKPSPKKGKPGRPHSDETRQKLSAAMKGKTLSEEHRQKLSAAKKGKTLSEEVRQKMSESRRGKSSPNKGKTFSEEHRKKISEFMKGCPKPKVVCRISDRKEYRQSDITQYGLHKLGLV